MIFFIGFNFDLDNLFHPRPFIQVNSEFVINIDFSLMGDPVVWLRTNNMPVLGTLPRTHRASLMIWMHNFITWSVIEGGAQSTATKHLSRDGTQWPIKMSNSSWPDSREMKNWTIALRTDGEEVHGREALPAEASKSQPPCGSFCPSSKA